MPDPMMVRLAVQTPDPPPLINNASTQVIASGNGTGGNTGSPNNNYSVHQATTDQINPATTATPPMTAGSVSPSTQQQQNSHQMAAQNIPPGAIPLNQLTPHHIPPYHHHPSGSNGGGVPHIHDHNNGHHHNGLYMPYPNEYYSPGSDGPPHYFLPPELCPAHTQICTVHPEYGPVTVPMVSQSGSPPIPMPHVQVPPGHVMQQIVDENGTLRHVILSTHHQQIQSSGHHIPTHYITANGSTPQHYYSPLASYPQAAAPTNQSQAPASANQLYPTMNHQPVSHSPSPPNNHSNGSSNNNNSSTNNNNYQNNERAQRQHHKLMRKLETRNNNGNSSNNTNQVHSQTMRINSNNSSNNDNLNGSSTTRRTLQRNGTSSNSAGGASSVGTTSDDGEESSSVPDEEDDFQNISNYLSTIEPPIVSEVQSHTALITWEPPPLPTSTDNALNNLNTNDIRYEIFLGDRGKDGKYKSIFTGTNLSLRVQHLRAAQEYYVSIVAHCGEVEGETTDPVQFTTPGREPDTPLQPKLITKTKNSIQLRWNAPNDNGAPIQYILEMSSDAEHDFTEIVKTKAKQFTVNKLQAATWYKFRLAAINEFGRSDYSVPASYVTDGYPPPQPLPPKIQNITPSSITLQWLRRREDGDFILQMTQMGTQGFLNAYYGPETKFECTRLQRATSYQFRLASKTESGQSSWSDEIAITTLPETPGRPSKPIVKGKIHAYNFKVKWDPPIDRGGADVSLYHLEISAGAIFDRIYSGPVNEAVCDRLSPGTTYQVRVCAEGPGGLSPVSDTCTVTTEAIIPNPPQTPYYSNLPGPYAAVLQWGKPAYLGGAPVVEYEFELEGILNDGAEKTKQRVVAYRGKDCYCVVKDLLPGETYSTRVRAVNRIGASEWSDEFCFRAGSVPPSKPSAPEVHVRSTTNLFVQWREPPCNGAPIVDYKLESSTKQGDDAVYNIVYHGTETSTDLKDLLPFTTYYFRLCAFNASGKSPFSPTVSQTTPAAQPGLPQLLTDLFVITSNTAHIFWTEPECNGDAIINYILECGDKQLSTNSNQTDLLIEHLNPETVFKVKVQAVNRIGAGVFTQYAKFTTKPLPPKPPRLECIQYGYNSLKLKWGNDSSTGSNSSTKSNATNIMHDFQRFEVDMKIKSSSKDFQNIYAGTRNSIKVQKLHESTVYSFRICAQTEHAGVGPWSDEYLFKTQAAQPNSVKIVKCSESTLTIAGESHADALPSLTVDWQHSKNNHFNDAIEYILQKALASNGSVKNLMFEDIYRGAETKFTIDNIDSGIVHSLRVIPVRLMKSKRTSSIGSTRTSSHDGIDEVDGNSSDDSDSDDERTNQTPVIYEDICGAPSPVVNYKLPKPEEIHASSSSGSAAPVSPANQSASVSTSRKGVKSSKSALAQSQSTAKKQHHHHSQSVQEPLHESTSNDDKSTDVVVMNQSLFLKLVNFVRAFFENRKNWSVTEESFIICFGFMVFTIFVGCILHYLMA